VAGLLQRFLEMVAEGVMIRQKERSIGRDERIPGLLLS
jgi:hypothetical protein